MKYGVISGMTWGLDTVVLGIALTMAIFVGAPEAAVASAFIHDLCCAVIIFVYMAVRGRLRTTLEALKTRAGKSVVGAAVLGGPLGMSGYLIAINNIGPGYTAIISAFYPAVGTLLAVLFLKERMKLRQVLALLVAMAGVMIMGSTSVGSDALGNPMLGIAGALLCVFGWGSEAVILAWGMRHESVDNEIALQIRETTSALLYGIVVVPVSGALAFSGKAIFTPAGGIIGIAAIAGVISYMFYYRALNTIGAARGMALNISYSAWAVIFSLILMRDVPSLMTVGCCVMVMVGTVLAATADWNDLRVGRKARQSRSCAGAEELSEVEESAGSR